MRPILKSVLIKPSEAQKESSEGILLPDQPDRDFRVKQAEVVAIGEGVSQFKVGDTVFYKRYAADDVEINGEMMYLIEESDVLLVL